MPLVHFPVGVRFQVWSGWSGLQSRAFRGLTLEEGDFGRLRGEHVFSYAGPSCFHKDGCIGDSLAYFHPSAEQGRTGSATPFDSGALEDPPKLRPWIGRSLEERWAFLRDYVVALEGYRERFARWLVESYDDPDRYLDTDPDRYAAGQPDRLQPPDLLEHNGTRGREKYGVGGCGDRRTWTWEVRFAGVLPFERVQALHVPFDALEGAIEVAERMKWSTGETPAIETLAPEVTAGPDALYVDSGRVLRKLVG